MNTVRLTKTVLACLSTIRLWFGLVQPWSGLLALVIQGHKPDDSSQSRRTITTTAI